MKIWADSLGEFVQEYSALIAEREADISSFLFVDVNAAAQAVSANGELAGLPFAVKDNIAVQGMPLSCGSRILENFRSPYSATAVARLCAAGAQVVAKTNLDEFGMGSSCDFSALAQSNNPWDLSRVCGGSSGGSAAAVAAGLVPFALGSDTGGSVRQPAAFCGVYGLKPTYGAVSRYGLVAYASSLDVIGVLSRDLGLCEDVFSTMRGVDAMDQTSRAPASGWEGQGGSAGASQKPRLAVLDGELGLSPEVQAGYEAAVQALSARYAVERVRLPILEYVVPVYYTISCAEASANLARFNGIRYGERPFYAENPDELVRIARGQGFGAEVKLRILLGTYVLRSGFQDRYYNRAQQIRARLRANFASLFSTSDLLMLPVFPTQAFQHGDSGLDSFQQKLADRFSSAANLAGLPALSCPVGTQAGLPCAVQFMAPEFREGSLFSVAQALAEHFPLEAPPAYPSVFA